MNVPALTWRRVGLIAAGLVLTIGGMILGTIAVIGLAIAAFAAGLELSDTSFLLLSLIGVQGIGFPLVGFVYLRYRGRRVREFVPVRVPSLREVGVIVGGWIGALVLVGIVGVAIQVTGTTAAENQAGQIISENPGFVPYLLPFVFLLNGPGEEFLFRGVIQGQFREEFHPAAAIVLATMMFAPIHIFSLVGSLQAAAVTIGILTLPSLVFGAVYEYTDNFVVPALVHSLYNATLFGSIYLADVATVV
ncbi:CPBP family intramembrane glutamic endopeptidase [Halorientalis halophila]|uniref:CPBP family intramembrane glutamic endopeptidase n=1 Tax=Halorientalis halophila TaxID=3108499 RepID=UPI00300A2645